MNKVFSKRFEELKVPLSFDIQDSFNKGIKLDVLLYTALNSPSFHPVEIWELFAHFPIFLYNLLCLNQLAQF